VIIWAAGDRKDIEPTLVANFVVWVRGKVRELLPRQLQGGRQRCYLQKANVGAPQMIGERARVEKAPRDDLPGEPVGLPAHGKRVLHRRHREHDRAEHSDSKRDWALGAPDGATLRHGHSRSTDRQYDPGTGISGDGEGVKPVLWDFEVAAPDPSDWSPTLPRR